MLLLARTLWRELFLGLLSGHFFQRRKERKDARSRTGADVEGTRVHLPRWGQLDTARSLNCATNISDIHVVARLESVAKYCHRRPRQKSTTENRHDSGFSVRILAGSINIAETQR